MPPFTKKKTQANDASTHSVVITGPTYECMALEAADELANSASGVSTRKLMAYFPNELVAKSVTILLITKAAITIARPMPDQMSVCFALSSRSGLPELVM